jgi:hypothetical protein
MPLLGFEPTIPASERAKTVHTLDRSATVTGKFLSYFSRIMPKYSNYRLIILMKLVWQGFGVAQ